MAQPKLRFKREDGTSYPNWKSGTIGDYYTFKNGLNKEKTAFGKGTPIINYTDVFKNRLITAKIIKGKVTLNEKEIENHSAKLGDVFFTRTSETLDEVGFCGALIEDIPNCVFSGFLLRGRPIDTSLTAPGFAGYYFMTMPIRQEIISKSSITTRALTNGRNLSAVNIKMPCLEEQQKIADFLSTIDEILAQSEVEVQNLEQQKKAAMQKIFSQEVRFRHENGTEFPEWEEKKLENIGHFYGGLTGKSKEDFGTGSSRYITYMNVNRNLVIRNDILETVDVSDNEKQNAVEYGDLIFTQSSETVDECGLTSVYLYSDKPYLNSFCMGFRLDNFNVTEPLFTAYLMRSERVRKEIMVNSQGISRINLSGNRILQMSILVPCLEEQQKIADFFSAYDEAISYAKQELGKWKELKKGLLQQMFV